MRLGLLIATGLLSSVCFAGETFLGASGNERCGGGSMVFARNNSIISQSFEEVTDAVSMDSFSITTGTSGCDNSGLVAVPQKEIFYARANFDELKMEMASGSGDVLEGFAETMGCPTEAIQDYLETSKSKYQNTFPSSATSPTEMILNFRKTLKSNSRLAQSCQSLMS